jgi:hypothetical protein
LKQVHELRTSNCPHPALVKRDWEEFRRWLDQSFQHMAELAETTKQTEIIAAAERRIQYELELAARLTQRKRAEEEKAALEAAEKAEFLRVQAEIEQAEIERQELERAEAEKSEALMLAELEAKKAEAAGKAPMISDPRVDNMEKSLEVIKAEQKMFKEVLEKHAKSQKETKSMLALIWEKLNKS